jgi:hypothetical protein
MEIDKDKIKYLTTVRLLYLLIKERYKTSKTPGVPLKPEALMKVVHNILDTLFSTGIFEILSSEEEKIATEYVEQINKAMIQKYGTVENKEGNA